MAKSESDSFIAEVFVKGLPEGNQTPAENTEIVVTNKGDDEKDARDVSCLFCGKEIE